MFETIQVLINLALICVLTIAFLYFGFIGFLHLDECIQHKRSVKHARKYEALRQRSAK